MQVRKMKTVSAVELKRTLVEAEEMQKLLLHSTDSYGVSQACFMERLKSLGLYHKHDESRIPVYFINQLKSHLISRFN